MFITDLLYGVLKTLGNITRDGFRTMNMMVLKMFPILAIPIFLFTAFGSIILNDQLWTSTLQGVNYVQSTGGGAKGGFLALYGKMNYFFPISESLFMLATLVPLKVICLGVRITKSWIPTVN